MSKKKLIKRYKWGARVNKFLAGGDINYDEYPLLKRKFLHSTEENPITINNGIFTEGSDESNSIKYVDDYLTGRAMINTYLKYNAPDFTFATNDVTGKNVIIYNLKDNNKLPFGYTKDDGKIKDELLNKRKQLDYIGGEGDNLHVNFYKKVPSLVNKVDSLSSVYGINKDIMLERLAHEGFTDTYIDNYNNWSSKEKQKNINNNILNSYVNAFEDLGLDTAGEHLLKGDYNLRWEDPNLGFWREDNTNEKGVITHSVGVPNLASGLEIKAAHIEYLTNLMRQRYPNVSKQELNALINAAYNIGENHKDLNNKEWINKNYKVVPWSELIDKKK